MKIQMNLFAGVKFVLDTHASRCIPIINIHRRNAIRWESGHVHTTERLTLTGHLWYAHGAAAGAVAPFGQSFDLDQVVLSRGDVQLHTGLIGFLHGGHCVPVLTIQNLQERADAVSQQ